MVALKGTRQVESQGQRETKEMIKNYKHLNDNSKWTARKEKQKKNAIRFKILKHKA